DLVVADSTFFTVLLVWTTPHGQNQDSRPARYDIRYGTSGISEESWANAIEAENPPIPSVPGDSDTCLISGLDPRTVYYMALKSYSQQDEASVISNVAHSATLIPPPVHDLRIEDRTESSMTVKWECPEPVDSRAEPDGYDIRYAVFDITEEGWGDATQAEDPSELEGVHTITGLEHSTSYSIGIKTFVEVGSDTVCSALAATASDSTLDRPPVVENLVVESVEETTITIGWISPAVQAGQALPVGYEIGYSESDFTPQDPESWWEQANRVDVQEVLPEGESENYTIKELDPGAEYAIAVRTISAGGLHSRLDRESVLQATSLDIPQPVTDLTATAVSSSQIDLSWTDASDNEDGFKIERGTSSTGPFTEIATVGAGATSYADTGLEPETPYWYQVAAYNADGTSSYVGPVAATTQPEPKPPTAPTDLAATASSSSQIDLSWTDASDNEDGFKIERGTSSTGPFTEIATVGAGATSYADTGLEPETPYWYQVAAYNADGTSSYVGPVAATTLAGMEIPSLPQPTINSDVDFQSSDPNAITAQGAVQTQLILASSLASMGQSFMAPLENAEWTAAGNCMTWTKTIGSCSWAYEVCEVSEEYVWTCTLNGDCVPPEPLFDDWVAVRGTTNTDGTQGEFRVYETNSTVVSVAWEWIAADDFRLGTWIFYDGDVGSQNQLASLNRQENLDGSEEITLEIGDYKFDALVAADGLSGWMEFRARDDSAIPWELEWRIRWNRDGTGTR
ncbi:fibronectin type III domain-containing protein, partial [Candidatus Eisenbacteria bacterium]